MPGDDETKAVRDLLARTRRTLANAVDVLEALEDGLDTVAVDGVIGPTAVMAAGLATVAREVLGLPARPRPEGDPPA